MSETIRFNAEPIRSLAYTSTSGAYAQVGTALKYPAHQFLVQNLTDATMMFSLDGTNDHFVLPAYGFFTNDITTNRTGSNDGWYLAANARIYVKRVGVPTTGTIYLSVFHANT